MAGTGNGGTGGNGSMEVKTPWGSIAANGRDILMLAMLGALGAGIIGTQLYTYHAFGQILAGARIALEREVARAADERTEIAALLRLRICTDVFLADVSTVKQTEVRDAILKAWTALCVAQAPVLPPAVPLQPGTK